MDVNRNLLKQKYGDEKVFVITPDVTSNVPDKFTKEKHDESIWTKYDNIGKYIPRWEAEYNYAFQQIIPYFLICNEDESKYFVSKRLQGDHRLTNKMSLGFGGHIDECDGYSQCILKAMVREMNEELRIDPISRAQYIGTIKDLSSDTNDHFGLAFIIKAKEGEVSILETEKLEGLWLTKEELFEHYYSFENWSRYIIDFLYENKK